MPQNMQTLFNTDNDEEIQQWFHDNAPALDQTLIDSLQQESEKLERENPQQALRIAHIVQIAGDQWQDEQITAVSHHLTANAYLMFPDPQEALTHYEQAAVIYQNLGLEAETAYVRVGQIAAMFYLGMFAEVLTIAEEAASTFRQIDDQLALGKILMNQGNSFSRQNRFQEAQASYAEARALFTELDQPRYLAMVNVNESIILTELNEFRQAENLLLQARDYFSSENMDNVVTQVNHNVAYLYLGQGDFQQALTRFDQVRNAFGDVDNAIEVAHVDLMRSDIYLALNLWQEALTQVNNALPVFVEAGLHWETGRLYLNKAAALMRLDPSDFPSSSLSQARNIFTQEGNDVWVAMTDLYEASFALRTNNLTVANLKVVKASRQFEAQSLWNRVAQCEIIQGETALKNNQPDEAIIHFNRGMSRLENANIPAIQYACLYGLARAAQANGRYQQALDLYREAINNIERLQATIGAEDYKIAFFSDKLEVYEALVVLCLEIGTAELEREAFEVVERAKSRALLDAIAREEIPETETSDESDLLQEIDRLKRELNWYYNQLNQSSLDNDKPIARHMKSLTEAVSQREQELGKLLHQWRSPDLASVPKNPIWTVAPEQIQETLPPNTTLIEYYTTGEQLVVFGISGNEMWSSRLDTNQTEIKGYVSQLRFQINKFSYGLAYRKRHATALQHSAEDILHRLYNVILAPIIHKLEHTNLIVVPHGILHYVPFHALFNGTDYLIKDKTISFAPSATILYRSLTNPKPEQMSPPLILGLSDETIPHAHQEASAIAELFPSAEVRLNEHATLDNLLINGHPPEFLHLSTHATFRAENPLFSSIKLADRWLSVTDIYNMHGNIPLVTLSACETGRHQVMVGDELVGLCRGFFAAGVKSLLVTLWMVDDSSTAQLMTRFYQEMKSGRSTSQALRAAQLATMADLPHPYYWAPFILTGGINI